MVQLAGFELSLLNVHETLSLGDVLVTWSGEFLSTEAWITRVAARIQGDVTTLQQVINFEGTGDLVRAVHEADEARDEAFVDFRLAVEHAQRRRRNPAVQQAGDELMRLIRRHDYSLHHAGLGEQTALTEALLVALAEPDAAAHVATIGLEADVQAVQQTHAAYQAAQAARQQQAQMGLQLPTRREATGKLKSHAYLLQLSLELLIEEDAAALEPAILALNQRIEPITTPAKARRTRRENDPTDDPSPDPAAVPA